MDLIVSWNYLGRWRRQLTEKLLITSSSVILDYCKLLFIHIVLTIHLKYTMYILRYTNTRKAKTAYRTEEWYITNWC